MHSRWVRLQLACTVALWLTAAVSAKPAPRPGSTFHAVATAYCQHGKTQSGTRARRGIVAADPLVLPVGSVLRVDGVAEGLAGIYTVMDTGSAVKGSHIDIFVPDCASAIRFGERVVVVQVLRRGWDPRASVPVPGR